MCAIRDSNATASRGIVPAILFSLVCANAATAMLQAEQQRADPVNALKPDRISPEESYSRLQRLGSRASAPSNSNRTATGSLGLLWHFTDEGFIDGGQDGSFRAYEDPNDVPASPWTILSDGFALRLDWELDINCVEHNPYTQSASATSTVTFAGDTIVTVGWTGLGEREAPQYELMQLSIDGALVGLAHAPGGGLGCAPMGPVVSDPPPPQQVYLAAGAHTIEILATTADPLYHFGAWYQFQLTFDSAAPQTGKRDQLPKQPGDPCEDPSIHANTPQGPAMYAESLPVGLFNGEAMLRAEDLRVPSRGFDFVWARTYSSRSNFSGHQGWNWHIACNRRVQLFQGTATVVDGGGREDAYAAGGAGTFISPAGFFDNLRQNGDGTFTQRMADGARYFYRADGWLTAMVDRNGNTQTISRNAAGEITTITDTQDRLYTFAYTSGLITSITDFAGRQLVYTYDGNGDLVNVRSPAVTGMPQPENDFPDGKTSLYTYSSGMENPLLNHNILSAIDPLYNVADDPLLSKAWVTLTYYPTSDPLSPEFDRVHTERWGHDSGGPPADSIVGGTTVFQYTETPDGDAPPGAVAQTTETDRNGNVTKHYFDATAHETTTIEEMNRDVRPGEGRLVTSYSYTSEGLLQEKILPRGNSVSYLYQDTGETWRFAEGLLLEERRKDNALGSDPDLVTRYTYEPAFQGLRSVTDPRAFPDGSVPGDFDPATSGFTTLNVFDYQEGTGFQDGEGVPAALQIPEGLGDQNGAVDFNEGNTVKMRHPPILTPGPNLGQTSESLRTWNDAGQRLTETDPEGTVTAYQYYPTNGIPFDPSDREGYLQFRRVDGAGFDLTTEYEYDVQGNVTRTIDPKGQDALYTVNQLNQVVRALSREADGPGSFRYQVDTIWDANDEMIERRIQNRDAAGAAYDNEEILERYEHNILHFLVSEEREKTKNDGSDAGLVRTEYFYDGNMNRTALRTPLAVSGAQPDNIVTTRYDERNLVYKVIRGDTDTDPATAPEGAVVVTSNYDANGNLLERIDVHMDNPNGLPSQFPGSALGDVTLFTYDGFDRMTRTDDGEGNMHHWVYDGASNVIEERLVGNVDETIGSPIRLLSERDRVLDERNRVVTDTAQRFDRRTGTAVGDGGSVTTYTYDRDSKVTQVTDDNNHNTFTQWDTADRIHVVRDHLNNGIEYGYDDNSNVTTETRREVSTDLKTAAETYVHLRQYDGLDRLVKTTDPIGSVRRFAYDSRDNLVETSDGVRGTGHPTGPGNIVRMDYDGLDRLVQTDRVLTANGRGDTGQVDVITTLQAWDDNSRLVTQTDDESKTTSYGYDAKDRRTRVTYADGTVWTYVWNEDNHNTQWTDANGTQCTQAFDGLERLKRREVAARPVYVLGATYEEFGYDGASQTTKVETDDIFGNTLLCRFEYDSMDNRTQDKQGSLSVDSVHDGVGNRTDILYPGRIGGTGRRALDLAYDELNRMQSVADGAGPVANWHYKGPTRLERRTYGNDAAPHSKTDCYYDGYPREFAKWHQTPAGLPIARFDYGYDREHHRLFEKRIHDGSLGDVYQYDSAYRVIRNPQNVDLTGVGTGQEILPETFNSQHFQRYTYDGVQNRLMVESTGGPIPPPPSASVRVGPVAVAQAELRFITTTYTHDEVNQYTETKATGHSPISYLYDENGNFKSDNTLDLWYDFKNRLVEVRQTIGGALVAQYAYDAANRRGIKVTPAGTTMYLYDGFQCIEERDGGGPITRQYVWGPGVDELLQEQTPKASYYAHENSIGSVCALTNSTGAVVERYRYDPFGITTVTLDGATGNRYRFHAAYCDDETGFYYMRNRTYHSGLGRFIQRDPIGTWGDHANLGDAYTFVGNDSVNGRDHFGLDGCCRGGLPMVTDDAGRRCCDENIQVIVLKIWTKSLTGHAFLEAPGMTRGFWPGPDGLFEGDGLVQPDDTEPFNKQRSYVACPETVEKLEAAMKLGGRYDLRNCKGRNCAGWVCERLQDAGIRPPTSPDEPLLAPIHLVPDYVNSALERKFEEALSGK